MTEEKQRNVWLGVLAATGIYVVYGLNMAFCKDIAESSLITPTALFSVRVGGAALLFWILSLFTPQEKLSGKDFGLAFLGSLLVITIPQFSFLLGITMASPFDASLIATLKPLLTMAVAFFLGREAFRWNVLAGVILCFVGALLIVIKPANANGAFTTSLPGFLLLLLNGLSVSFYLVLFKDFVSRHSAVSLMKWMFLFALVLSIPFSVKDLGQTHFSAFGSMIFIEIGFLVVFATFLTYFVMPTAQRHLTATQYSLFSYVQCIVAAVAGILMGLESLTVQKIIASVFFVGGVLVVIRPGKK